MGNKPECINCELKEICVQRGVLYLMDHVEVTECFMPKKNKPFIYYMGTLPIT